MSTTQWDQDYNARQDRIAAFKEKAEANNAAVVAGLIKQEKAEQRLRDAAPVLLEALRFYVFICGNTAYSVTRESAQEAYTMARAAIRQATGGEL